MFGNSPDETAFARLALQRETVGEGVTMLQPLLYSYAMGAAPEPVLLDVSSIAPDRVLLLDAYFYVVVFHGTTVAQWRKAGYAEQPEYAAFKALLEVRGVAWGFVGGKGGAERGVGRVRRTQGEAALS